MKIYLETKQNERFLEDQIIIRNLALWGGEAVTSLIRTCTPKTLHSRKYKNGENCSARPDSEGTKTPLSPEAAPLLYCLLTCSVLIVP